MNRLYSHVSQTPIILAVFACLLLADFSPKAAKGQTAKGYTVRYLDAWPANDQIKYVRIEIIANSGASMEDLDFHVVGKSSGRRNGTTVSTVVPIRKGDAKATGELFVPVSAGYNFALHTELDGDHRSDRSDFAARNYFDYQYSNSTMDESTPPLVFASSEVISDEYMAFPIMTGKNSAPIGSSVATSDDFPGMEDLESWYEATRVNVGGGKKYMNINGFTSSGVAAMSLEALPSKWFGYEGLGLLVVTFDDMKLLAKKHPGKLLAIERWVAASGRLAVLNCGDEFENVNEALRLLGDDNAPRLGQRNCNYLQANLKEGELQSALEEASQQAQQNNGFYLGGNQLMKDTTNSAYAKIDVASGTLNVAKGKAKDFIAIDFEKGQVICVTDFASDWSQQRPKDIDGWGPFGLFLKRISKNKVEHVLLNSDTIRQFGFPEFAEPPRYLFEFSILAYLLAVGPVAFFVLKRKRKLNLMFILVPVISSIFCTGILAWAIFAEGFDTRVNQFTFTELNQQSGRQTTSAVSHVYSGMTPSPYRLEGSTYGFVNLPYAARSQRIHWGDGGEEISGGEIRARTNHQLFTRCSNESTGKLVFAFKGEGESATASVRNEFETKMVCLAFRSDECARNECWYCSQLEPGSVSEAERMKLTEVAKLIRAQVRDRGSRTVFAAGNKYAPVSRNSTYNYYGSDIASSESSAMSNSLRKAWHLADIQLVGLFRNENAYFALTEESTNHKTAISNAKMESEIHILQGVR